MARGKSGGSQKSDAAGSSAGVGHNSEMTDDQRQALTRDYKRQRAGLVEKEKAAKAARMNLDKKIKADLGAKGLDDIKLLEMLETPEGEKMLKADIERRARVARWAGLQIGTQGSLFDEDRRPLTDRAKEEGKAAGMEGRDCKSPYDGEAGNSWVEGWHEGQAILAQGFKKGPEPDAELVKGKKKKSGPDEFDTAAEGSGPTEEGWPDDEDISRQKAEETA